MVTVETIPVSLFEANCYLVSAHDQVLVIDPGPGTGDVLKDRLQSSGKTVGAVLLTHGHVDHVWEAYKVASQTAQRPAPVFVPGPDRSFLETNPAGAIGLSPEKLGLDDWQKPSLLLDVPVGPWEILPGIVLQMVPAPGHSPGSAVFLTASSVSCDGAEYAPCAFSGDVIFAGSVGRTDFSGGDEEEMRQSLRTLALVVDPATVLFPGHGPQTVWQTEIETNPYVIRARTIG